MSSIVPLPIFDPTQTRMDRWVNKKNAECKVIQIACDKDLIDVIGEPISLLFTISDKLKYQLTCPREYLITASRYFAPILGGEWYEKKSDEFEMDLCNHDVLYSKEHFVMLSNYINTGVSTEQEWTIADLKAIYEISNLLNIKEVRKRAEKGIITTLSHNRCLWPECLSFGIRRSSSPIIKAALDILIREYEKSIENPPSKQYVLNKLSLIKKSVSHLKQGVYANTIMEKAQQAFDQYIAKKNTAKFKKIFQNFERSCKYASKPSECPNLSKELSSLKDIAKLLPESEEIISKVDKLFQDYQTRMLEPSEDSNQ